MAMRTTPDPISAGREALLAGDWLSARVAFESALAAEESPEALDGLGQSLWWLNELKAAIELRERAYAVHLDREERAAALGIAIFLAREYFTVHGNFAASAGWLQRAERLSADVSQSAQHGWLELLKGRLAQEGEQMLRHAEAAMRVARGVGDSDLELVGLSLSGLGLVHCGRVMQGMAPLDESMAAATGGEVKSFWSIADIYCNTLLACERAGDFDRAEQWGTIVSEWARRRSCVPLFPFCHVTHGGLLMARGHWEEAEKELELALETFGAGHRAMRVLALSRLAELRIRQGRIEEAEQLVAGYEEHPLVLRSVVGVYVATGQPDMATDLITRRLAHLQDGSLMGAPLLVMLVDALLAKGDLEGAASAAARLANLTEGSDQPSLIADTESAIGRVAVFAGEPGGIPHLESALELYLKLAMPLEAARMRLALARARANAEPPVAAAYARQAMAEFDRLGAARDRDAAAELLRRLGVRTRGGPKGHGHATLTKRELEVLQLLEAGLTNPEIAARLFISEKTTEHHVSRILAKLNLKNRSEAAVYSARIRQ